MNAVENYILATYPCTPFDNNCSCVSSLSSCSRPLYIDQYWTLECFFDSQCIHNLTTIASSHSTTIWIAAPLNASIPSTFAVNTLIATTIDALFIEEWVNTSNYSSYFAACAPYLCSYNYVEHEGALFIITTLLGLYGGLTVTLRFAVWYRLHVYRKIVQWMGTLR
jgi:hypothetical protein